MEEIKKKRVTFYVDGFNFYFGLKDGGPKWQKFYWIDMVEFCKKFLEENEELESVNYYTAEPENSGKRQRQGEFLKVNMKLHPDKFKVIRGKYKQKSIICGATCEEEFKVPEEKETDVKIAIDIIENYILGNCDKTMLITADSDLLPPLRSINRLEEKINKGHKILVLFPPNRHSNEIKKSFDILHLKSHRPKFNHAHLPQIVRIDDSSSIEIPIPWKRFTVT